MRARSTPRVHPGVFVRVVGVLVTLGLLAAGPARADVVRVVVERQTVVWEGRSFGEAGSYELLQLRLYLVFDPRDPTDAAIVDLALAPRNSAGLVEAEVTAHVLQPVDVQRRRKVAWVDLDRWEVGPAAPLFAAALRGGTLPDEGPGDGLLLEAGLTLIQLDAGSDGLPWVEAPGGGVITASDSAGGDVVGWVRRRWEPPVDTDRLVLDGTTGWHHPVALPDAPVHTLVRGPVGGPATDTVPGDEWHFVPLPGGDDARYIVRDDGFTAGEGYELIYRARTPRIQGLSLAAVRDIMVYARYNLRSVIPADRGIAFGSGLGGRLLREFLHDGFNDAGGRPAFDLVWAHGAGAGRGDIHRRFAQPGEENDFVDLFPFTLEPQFDPATGREAGLLPSRPAAAPRTLFTHPGSDYWERGASLTHTALDGLSDRVPADRHRAYHLAGVVAGPHTPASTHPDPRPLLRAVAVGAVRWIVEGTPLPPSRVPTLGAGTLVRPAAVPPFAGTDEASPLTPRPVYRVDPGLRFDSLGIADRVEPLRGAPFPVLVPQVDGLGNEVSGVRPVELRVPLASYRFGLRGDAANPFGAGPPDEDPRPVVGLLYESEGDFLARLRAAADALVAEGFLLERDRRGVTDRARRLWARMAPWGR